MVSEFLGSGYSIGFRVWGFDAFLERFHSVFFDGQEHLVDFNALGLGVLIGFLPTGVKQALISL